jgi:hypothetical protein
MSASPMRRLEESLEKWCNQMAEGRRSEKAEVFQPELPFCQHIDPTGADRECPCEDDWPIWSRSTEEQES